MKTAATAPKTSRKSAKPAPFALDALILRKGDGRPALRFQYVSNSGTVYAMGATHDEEDPRTMHDLGNDLSRIVAIPAAVTLPDGSTLHTQNRDELAALVKRADRHFRASARAWENRNDGSALPKEEYARLERKEQDEADKGAALLAPLGIVCSWPGLYPSFTVHGYGEHATETAVLAAVGLPRNALVGYLPR